MRIGLSSIVGDGFGTGSFQISEIAGAISFPPAGSYNSTLFGVEYPVAQGGTSFANPVTAATVPNQICDVDVENDGAGGTYTDWSTATNIQFKAFGNVFYTDPTPQSLDIEVPYASGNYYQGGTYYNEFFHDGTGFWSSQGINPSYYSNGTDTNIALVGDSQTTEVPSGSGVSYNNGRFNGYTWDGSGGYNYPVTKGNYYASGTETGLAGLDVPSQTEVPSGSGNYYDNGQIDGYTWDGAGGYNYPVSKGNYYASGTDTNLSGLDVAGSHEVPTGSGNFYASGDVTGYTWDGSGGYNSGVSKGSQYPTGTVIFYTVTSTSTSTEVPSGSGNYFDSYVSSGDLYKWDFAYSPPYTYNGAFYYPSGTYITNYSGTDYYWDGTGGFYP